MLTITQTGQSASNSQRMLDQAVKAAAEATVEYWHSTYLPRHFTEAGFDLYNYQPRKGQGEPSLIYSDGGVSVRMGRAGRLINNPKYYWKKWRRFKTHDPLVLTGTSKRQAEASIRISSRRTLGGSTITAQGAMDLPRYFYQYNKSVGAPNKVDELLRTVPAEDADMLVYFNNAAARHLAAASAPATTSLIA